MDASVFVGLLALVCGLLAVIAATVWWPVPGESPDGEPPLADAERRGVADGSAAGPLPRKRSNPRVTAP
ncbi:hypothetical protein [Nocardia lijiangensis]|uniref:hypothetical protein n=1 Tax=Nocardia lijiangensis TaxID=299618 RepID=UPI0008320473|nr:hypothetical protein [Nocardia lijiangensis]